MYKVTLKTSENLVKNIDADRVTLPENTGTYFFRKGSETVAMIPMASLLVIEKVS